MGQKEIVVYLCIGAGFLAGALIAYLFFTPANWSEAKSIIYLSAFVGALLGYFLAKKIKP